MRTPESVHFRITDDPERNCHDCVHRVDHGDAPSTCELVDTIVNRDNVCDLFEQGQAQQGEVMDTDTRAWSDEEYHEYLGLAPDSEDRKTLKAADLKELDDSDFAYIDSEGGRHLPIHDEAHVRAALSRFNQTQFESDADKEKAAKKIAAAAEKFDIEIDPDSAVGEAAGLESKEEKAGEIPETAAERREASLSFGDTQSAVYQQLLREYGDADGDADLWIYDCANDWVVFQCYDGTPGMGLWRVGYTIDADLNVTITGEPEPVNEETSYVPAEQEQKSAPKRPTTVGRDRKPRHRAGPALGREFRKFAINGRLEIRTASNDPSGNTVEIVGQPIMYNAPYSVYDAFGEFEETMHPGVCANVLSSPELDCRFLINHDGLPLGRTLSGTLTLADTPDFLDMAVRLDIRQQLANDLVIAIERGDVTQMSCGFVVASDQWSEDYCKRDIYSFAQLFDVSAVTYPASPSTSIQVNATQIPVESRARIRQAWLVANEVRAGKVLSKDNAALLQNALEAIHSVDFEDVRGAIDGHADNIGAAADNISAVLDAAGETGESPEQQDGTLGDTGDDDVSVTTDDGTGTRSSRSRLQIELDLLHLRSRS